MLSKHLKIPTQFLPIARCGSGQQPNDHVHLEFQSNTPFGQLDDVVPATSKCCGATSRKPTYGSQCLARLYGWTRNVDSIKKSFDLKNDIWTMIRKQQRAIAIGYSCATHRQNETRKNDLCRRAGNNLAKMNEIFQ